MDIHNRPSTNEKQSRTTSNLQSFLYGVLSTLALLAFVAAAWHITGVRTAQQDQQKTLGEEQAEITVAFVGDVLPINSAQPLRFVADALRQADIAFANLESPLSKRGQPNAMKHRNGRLIYNEFIFGGKPETASMLADAGIDVVSLANNHMMDYGPEALKDTIQALDATDIAHSGAGENLSQAREAAIVERSGIRFAFLSYVAVNTLPSDRLFAADDSSPGLAFVYHVEGGFPSYWTKERIKQDIHAAREQAQIVIVSFHWGRELHSNPSPFQRRLGKRAVDFGADLVVGHHPHTLQGVEMHQGKPILYSLGNFVFPSRHTTTRQTAIAYASFTESGLTRLWFRSAWITGDTPRLAEGRREKRIAERLVKLSRSLGTAMVVGPKDGATVAALTSSGNTDGAAANASDMVRIRDIVPEAVIDLRYATEDNVFGRKMYTADEAFLRRTTANKLMKAQEILKQSGVRLKIWDAYRPHRVQKIMWEHSPKPGFVANPRTGSDHNRGAAVDVTLVDRDGNELEMPTTYDSFTTQARSNYNGGTKTSRQHRAILRHAMQQAGFRPLSTEWWHYSDPQATKFPVMDTTIAELVGK